jgi:membrane protein implicated in regulation of membrane protease activity
MFFGISVTFASGFVAYAVGAIALWLIVRRLLSSGRETSSEPEGDAAAEDEDGELVAASADGNGTKPEVSAEVAG